MNLKEVLETISGQKLTLTEGLDNEVYLSLNVIDLQKAICIFDENSFELISLFCVEDFAEKRIHPILCIRNSRVRANPGPAI